MDVIRRGLGKRTMPKPVNRERKTACQARHELVRTGTDKLQILKGHAKQLS